MGQDGIDAMAGFRCECCRRRTAREPIPLRAWTGDHRHAEPTRFAVTPEHVARSSEAVVMTFPHFWIVEKFGVAGDIAEELAGLGLTSGPSGSRDTAGAMSQENVEIIRRLVDAWNRQDIEGILALIDPDG